MATHTDDTMTLVFVYGTLMQGEGNHGLLAGDGATYLGPGRTEPAFTLLSLGGFPAAVPGGATAVDGEIYLVDPPTLARLDRLEGHPGFYLRTTIRLAGGTEVAVYVMPEDRLARRWGTAPIPSGSWRAHRRAQREVA